MPRGGRRSTGASHACDLLVMSGRPQPAYSLLAQAGARVEYDAERGIFVPTDLPGGSRPSVASPARVSAAPSRPRRTTAPRQGQVLRLRLRGRDRQGHEARDRRGLRLDRARQALHDRDDGPVPGALLPPRLDPALRARERDGRGGDRDDDRAAAVGAGHARAARGPAARAGEAHVASTTATRSSAPRSCGRAPGAGRTPTATPRPRRSPCTTRSASSTSRRSAS